MWLLYFEVEKLGDLGVSVEELVWLESSFIDDDAANASADIFEREKFMMMMKKVFLMKKMLVRMKKFFMMMIRCVL